MPFARGHIDKAAQYAQSAVVLANTAENLGYQVEHSTKTAWSRAMPGLVEVDYLTEETPDTVHNTSYMLNILGVQEATPQLCEAAKSLCAAMLDSPLATNIDEHYISRGEEASRVVEIFRQLSPEGLQTKAHLWTQISKIAILGIYTDSLVDAKDDATKLPFSEKQLILGALRYSLATVRQIEIPTWLAVLRAAHKEGLNYSIARKLSIFAVTGARRIITTGTENNDVILST